MKTEIISKHALIGRAPAELYMMFSDMRNFVQFLPADKREGIRADFDNIYANVQGFDLGVTVAARQPYSRIDFKDNGAPFPFSLSLFFSATPEADPAKTDFHIELSAELNFMMKMLLGDQLSEIFHPFQVVTFHESAPFTYKDRSDPFFLNIEPVVVPCILHE